MTQAAHEIGLASRRGQFGVARVSRLRADWGQCVRFFGGVLYAVKRIEAIRYVF